MLRPKRLPVAGPHRPALGAAYTYKIIELARSNRGIDMPQVQECQACEKRPRVVHFARYRLAL